MTDLLGHIGYLFVALGIFFLGQHNKIGWLLRFVGEAVWIVIGFAIGMTSIWVWGFVFCALDLRGYYVWKQRKDHDEVST